MGEYRVWLVGAIVCLGFGILFILILILTPSEEWETFIIVIDSIELPGRVVFIIVAAIFTPIGIICAIVYAKNVRAYTHY